MFKLSWENEEPSTAEAHVAFDRSTAEQRVKAAHVISRGLLDIIESLGDRADLDPVADRDYVDSLVSKMNSRNPSIGDIWIAAQLVREHKLRQKRALVKARSIAT